MPFLDKPDWITHGGASIHGVDIDASSARLATCGSDDKVRIWAMRAVLSESKELDNSVPKQLAVLTDFGAPINCVRFAPSGRLLAAGSDDGDAFVYELREGRGTATFGSGETANVENWRLRARLRGHSTNVTDLAWAPDSCRLATSSVDNKVKIWDASAGQCIRTLEGHHGHVKGVAWDPFDIFLASQGDREAIVWRLEDAAIVTRIVEPFTAAPVVGFAERPSWSPDGQTLALANGYDSGAHTVPLIRRNSWAANDFALAGHKGPVTVVRHNPHLYLPPSLKRTDGAADAAAGSGAEDDAAGAVVAAGSTDRQFSVWHPAVPAPVLVAKGCFSRMINDVAWSSDGRTLLMASQDGSVAVCVFEEGELGRRVPDSEVQALLVQLYGDPRLRNQKSALTAAPDLLDLEVRARADEEREERLNSRMGAAQAPAAPAAAAVAGGAAGLRSTMAGALVTRQLAPRPVPRVPPQPLPSQPAAAAPAAAIASPIRPLSTAGGAALSARDPDHPPAKRATLHGGPANGGLSRAGGLGAGARLGAPAAATAGGAGAGAGRPGIGDPRAPTGADAALGGAVPGPPQAVLVPPEPIVPRRTVIMYRASGVQGELEGNVELQVLNTGDDGRSRPAAEVMCVSQRGPVWTDCLQDHVVVLAGSSRMAAVCTTEADLMVWSPAGRRLVAPLCLESPAAFLYVAPDSMLLLAVLANGRVRMWDFAQRESVLESSVAHLLRARGAPAHGTGPVKVIAARISASGRPVVVLSNGRAHVHDAGLKDWIRVADDAFPASVYSTHTLSAAATGELSRLQGAAAQCWRPQDVLAAAAVHAARPALGARSDQALLEHNLAASAVLQSAAEWRLWLVTYVRRLAAEEDEARLRELISEFMGPLRWTPATQTAAAVSRGSGPGANGITRGGGCTGGAEVAAAGSSSSGRWQPSILGFDKRRLLRDVLLREVAKNRNYQPLVAEVLDQLRQLEAGTQIGRAVGGVGGGVAGVAAAGAGIGQTEVFGRQGIVQVDNMSLG